MVQQFGRSQKLNRGLPYDSASPLLSTRPKEVKAGTQTDLCIPMFTGVSFITVAWQKQPKGLPPDDWINRCGTPTKRNSIQPKKRLNLEKNYAK